MPTAEILSQGDEVVTGQIADTNAAWLSEQLTGLGFDVTRHTTVGDRLADLVGMFDEVASRCDLAVGTGGLGPTEDDLTAQAMADCAGAPLVLDPEALQQIQDRYAKAGRTMPEVNRKQAWLPEGALRLDNQWGTAPGFALKHRRAWMVFLPGVPREMRGMFPSVVLPLLNREFHVSPGRLVTLRTTGIGESNLQERVSGVSPGAAVMGFRTSMPENHVKLRFPSEAPADAVAATVTAMAQAIGSSLFAIDGVSDVPVALDGPDLQGGGLSEVVGRALTDRGATLAIAESCTGGGVASRCASVPGASGWLIEAVVSYANASKVRRLGVDPALIAAHGAVSEPVARQMAEGIRSRAETTFGLATTGIAGPGGGSAEKPVGTVHMALATPTGTHHRMLRFLGNRSRVQSLASAAVLDLLRRHLQGRL